MLREAPILGLALMLGLGCGSRTGVGTGVDPDAGTMDARTPDAARDGFVPDRRKPMDARRPEDAARPLGCDGRPLPRPGAVSSSRIPPRMQGLAVMIPEPLGLLFVGGRTSRRDYAEEMVFLELGSGDAQSIPVTGAPVRLPLSSGVAVYVPRTDQVVVVGGRISDREVTDQTFLITGMGDPSGLRSVHVRRLPPFPAGPVQGHVGVFDPVGQRIVVHGGYGTGDEEPGPYRTTWALELDPTVQWRRLLPPEDSPPQDTKAMGYEPARHRAIEIASGDAGAAVYALSLEPGSEGWQQLDSIDFVPSTRGELHFDESVCGFHLLSARRTRCVLEHWVLSVSSDEAATVFRGELELDPAHFLGSSLYIEARDELVVGASRRCGTEGPNPAVHHVALSR